MTAFRGYLQYIAPIENVSSIIEHGLLSKHRVASTAPNHRSIALEDVQEKRENKTIPNGLNIHDYVNLFFDARNPMMYRRIKEGETSICVLIVSSDVLELEGVVLTDMNATCMMVKAMPPEDIESLDFETIYMKFWTNPPELKDYQKAVKCAEVLVPGQVPFTFILGALVPNEAAKGKLVETGFPVEKVKVHADTFFK